jgi:hypothetical protein
MPWGGGGGHEAGSQLRPRSIRQPAPGCDDYSQRGLAARVPWPLHPCPAARSTPAAPQRHAPTKCPAHLAALHAAVLYEDLAAFEEGRHRQPQSVRRQQEGPLVLQAVLPEGAAHARVPRNHHAVQPPRREPVRGPQQQLAVEGCGARGAARRGGAGVVGEAAGGCARRGEVQRAHEAREGVDDEEEEEGSRPRGAEHAERHAWGGKGIGAGWGGAGQGGGDVRVEGVRAQGLLGSCSMAITWRCRRWRPSRRKNQRPEPARKARIAQAAAARRSGSPACWQGHSAAPRPQAPLLPQHPCLHAPVPGMATFLRLARRSSAKVGAR